MMESTVWGAPEWATAAVLLMGAGLLALAWSYWRAPSSGGVRLLAGVLKLLGLGLLAMFLVEPMLRGTKPRTGANLFVIAADNSQSLTIHDRGSETSRAQGVQDELLAESAWQTHLAEEFDLRRF